MPHSNHTHRTHTNNTTRPCPLQTPQTREQRLGGGEEGEQRKQKVWTRNDENPVCGVCGCGCGPLCDYKYSPLSPGCLLLRVHEPTTKRATVEMKGRDRGRRKEGRLPTMCSVLRWSERGNKMCGISTPVFRCLCLCLCAACVDWASHGHGVCGQEPARMVSSDLVCCCT